MLKDHKKIREEQAEFFAETAEIRRLCAEDAMVKPVLVQEGDESETILKRLKEEDINACIVVDKDKRFIGEISDNDIIRLFMQQTRFEPLAKILNRGYRREFIYKTAKEMANKHKHTAVLDTPINKIIMLVNKPGFEYVPVVDDDKRVIGVVTPSSLIDLLKEY